MFRLYKFSTIGIPWQCVGGAILVTTCVGILKDPVWDQNKLDAFFPYGALFQLNKYIQLQISITEKQGPKKYSQKRPPSGGYKNAECVWININPKVATKAVNVSGGRIDRGPADDALTSLLADPQSLLLIYSFSKQI